MSTDDPAMFDTDLTVDYAAARELGIAPQVCYAAGVKGALCTEQTRERLRQIGSDFDWSGLDHGGDPETRPSSRVRTAATGEQ